MIFLGCVNILSRIFLAMVSMQLIGDPLLRGRLAVIYAKDAGLVNINANINANANARMLSAVANDAVVADPDARRCMPIFRAQ